MLRISSQQGLELGYNLENQPQIIQFDIQNPLKLKIKLTLKPEKIETSGLLCFKLYNINCTSGAKDMYQFWVLWLLWVL